MKKLDTTIGEVQKAATNFIKILHEGDSSNKNNLFSSLNASEIPTIPTDLKDEFDAFQRRFNESTLSAEVLKEEIGDVDQRIIDYASTCKNGSLSSAGFAKSLQSMTLGAKAATLATQALSAAGNMFISWAVSKVIETVAAQIYNYAHRVEIAKKAMEDAKSSFDNTRSELDGITSALDNNKTRMAELLSLPTLTYVEQNELDKLKEASKELERQRAAKDIKLKRDAEELSRANRDSFNKEFGDNSFSNDDVKQLDAEYEDLNLFPSADVALAQEGIEGIAAALIKIQKAKEEASSKNDQEWLGLLTERETSYKSQLEDNLSSLQTYRDNLNDLMNYRQLTKDEKDFYDNLEQGMRLIYQYTDPSTWNQIELDSILDSEDLDITKEKLIELAKAGKLDEDTLKQYSKLNTLLGQADYILDEDETAANAFISQIKELANSGGTNAFIPSFDISDESTAKTIDNFQQKLSTLSSALDKVKEQKLTGSELLDLQQQFPSLIDTTDDLNVALRGLVDDSLAEVVNYLNANGAPEGLISSLQQLADETKELSTANWADTLNVFDSADSKIKSLAELTKALGDNYTLTADQARTFAEVFPELLALGETTSSGLIEFNRDVISDFVTNKQIEIQADKDSQIAQLENKKLELEGQMAAAQAALELIYAQANGEIDGENQKNARIAEARDNLVQHLMDIGVEEANADAAAKALMAGSMEEYDRVVSEVSDNVDNNLTGSIDDAARNVTNQARSMIEALFKVGKQALNSSKSLEDMGDDQPDVEKEKLDNTRSSKKIFKASNVLGTFKKTTADHIKASSYQPVDNIKDLEEDLSKYKESIDNIDSQIILLKADTAKTLNDYAGSLNTSGSNTSDTPTIFDYIARKIELLTKARDRLNKVVDDNRKPYLEQISMLDQVLEKDRELEAAAKEAAEEYQKSWESAAAKLSESDMGKIMENALSMDEYTGSYVNDLSAAQDAWSKYQDAVSQVDDYTNQTAEDIAGQFEKIRNITNASIDRIKQHVSDIQNLMDEAEAMGLYATEAQYRSLIQYADQEISKQKALRASYIRELASIAPGTEAYQKQLKAIQDCEDAISDCRQNQIKWNKSVLELPIQYINREIDGLNDDLNDLKKTQEVLDNTISGVTTHLQEQAEAQQKLRDEAEKAAQEKIDAIQAEIDGLTETNEKRKQQLDLEQKQYDLNRARNQKTNRVFREDQGDFVYEADQEAVRDAQEAYDETLFDRQISDLEDKITGIEESRDALLESYDQEIERLQEIMDSWNDISAAIERAKNIALAGSTLGAGWEDRVTSGDTSDFNHVTGEYGDNLKQQSWVEVQIEENERLIDQIEKYVEAWQLGELDIEEAYDHITAITTDIQPMMEANEQRISDLGEFSDKWSETDLNINLSLEDINAANSEAALAEGVVLDQRITKLTAFTEQYESLTSRVSAACRQIIENCRDAMDAMDEADVDEGISSGSSAAPNHDSDSDVNHGPGVYARGMENGLVHGTSSDRERENMLKYLSMTSLAKGEIPIIAHESEAILNESQQVQLLKNFDTALSYRPYSTPEQLKALDQIYRQDISAGIVQSSRSNTNSLVNQRQLENSVAVNFGDINLPQVRNADAFAKAVNSGFLGSIIQQQLYKKM